MMDRAGLRRTGAARRRELGLDQPSPDLAAGLADLVDELVYGRVWARPGLATEERMLATLVALTCHRERDLLRRHVEAALGLGLAPTLIQEAVLHCGMYAGLTSAIAALEVVAAVTDEQAHAEPADRVDSVDTSDAVDTGDAAHVVDSVGADLDELEQLGRQTMATLHETRAADDYAAPDALASTLYTTAVDYLYGAIWNRPGITIRQRMICSVAAFTALGMEAQQRKFFRSALNVGLSEDEVVEVIVQTGPYSGFPSALNALAVAEAAFADS